MSVERYEFPGEEKGSATWNFDCLTAIDVRRRQVCLLVTLTPVHSAASWPDLGSPRETGPMARMKINKGSGTRMLQTTQTAVSYTDPAVEYRCRDPVGRERAFGFEVIRKMWGER